MKIDEDDDEVAGLASGAPSTASAAGRPGVEISIAVGMAVVQSRVKVVSTDLAAANPNGRPHTSLSARRPHSFSFSYHRSSAIKTASAINK